MPSTRISHATQTYALYRQFEDGLAYLGMAQFRMVEPLEASLRAWGVANGWNNGTKLFAVLVHMAVVL